MHSDEFITIVSTLGIILVAVSVWLILRMVNSRRRPSARFWKTIAVACSLLLLYLLGFGPAYWWQHSSGSRVIPIIYSPLCEITSYSPRWVQHGLARYALWGVTDDGQRFAISPTGHGPRVFYWLTHPVIPPDPNRGMPRRVNTPAATPDTTSESN
jgi:hypothetical protein